MKRKAFTSDDLLRRLENGIEKRPKLDGLDRVNNETLDDSDIDSEPARALKQRDNARLGYETDYSEDNEDGSGGNLTHDNAYVVTLINSRDEANFVVLYKNPWCRFLG